MSKIINVLITCGATQEPIDPIRYISNHSSGKMGYALTNAFLKHDDISVTLITAPTSIEIPSANKIIKVITANEMFNAVSDAISDKKYDIFVGVAAVSDYRIKNISAQKIKKVSEQLELTLIKNPDIITHVANSQRIPFVVGFAAETDNLLKYAQEKLIKKNLDMIIANQVSKTGFPFAAETNEVLCLSKQTNALQFERMDKQDLADKLTAIIIEQYRQKIGKIQL